MNKDIREVDKNVTAQAVNEEGYVLYEARCGKFAVDVFKGFRPVMFGISLAEQIEVDAVHDQTAIHRMMSFGLCGVRAGLRCCRGAQHREKEAGKPETNGLPVEKRT